MQVTNPATVKIFKDRQRTQSWQRQCDVWQTL